MTRRRWVLAAVVMIVVAAIGGWWWTRRAATPDTDAAGQSDVAAERARIVGDKRAARDRGDVDVRPASIGGRITSAADGRPLAGATVLLTPKGFGDGSSRSPGKQAEPLHARTDARGDYRIDHVTPGRFSLSASARGFLPARMLQLDVAAGQHNGDRDLALQAGGIELRGNVADIGGGAIEGALVQITRRDEGNLLDFGRSPSAVITDEEGAFVVTLPRGAFTVAASHPEYVREERSVQLDVARTVELVLTPGASISGVVRALPDGAPVAGAVVFANDGDGNGSFAMRGWGDARVTTDEAGAFELRGLPAGVRVLIATSSDHASVDTVEVALGVAEQVSGIEIWVEPSYRISGFVVRNGAEREGGLEGVLVGAFSLEPTGLFVATAPSAEDGYFEIHGVRSGNYMVGAIGEEALPNLMGTSAQVRDANVDDLLVVMDPGVTVRGRVEPAMAASVTVSIDGESMGISQMIAQLGNSLLRTRAGDDGSFELRPCAQGKLKLRAQADDGSVGELTIDVGDIDMDGVVIELQPRTRITGRVEDANGKPVGDVKVSATLKDGRGREGGMSFSFDGVGGVGRSEANTAADGSFVLTGVEGGRYEISVGGSMSPLAWAKPEDPEKPEAPRELEVPSDRGLSDVVLVVEARDGVIRGRVLDDDGGAIADAWVTAYRERSVDAFERSFRPGGETEQRRAEIPRDDDENSASAARLSRAFGKERPVLTDETGAFTVTDLRAGTYTVVAEADGGTARAQQTAVKPGARVTLELGALGAIAGRVEAGSTKLEQLTISVEGPVERGKQTRDGNFRIERLDPGHYEVTASGKQGVAHAEIDVENGKTSEVVLELEANGSLRGIVVDGTGAGVAGLTVVVMGEDNVSARGMMGMLTGTGPKTGSDGRFELDDVPAGEGKVMFMDRDAIDSDSAAEASYTLEGGGTQDLGTITAVVTAKVPAGERGELGISTHIAKWDARPRMPGDDDDRAAPDEAEHLWVLAVDVGGAAEAAGIEPGDELLSIDGQSVTSIGARMGSAMLRPSNVRERQSVRVELDRAGASRSATMTARARAQPGKPK